jgi:sulfur-oxidizing protein SoxA
MFAPAALALLLGWSSSAALAEIPPGDKRSDTSLLAPETRAMQQDDMANPGMLTVADGEDLWRRAPASGAPACAGCHAEGSLKGVAARYPAWSETAARPVSLDGRVEECRTLRQGEAPSGPEDPRRLALSAFVAHQSRGVPIALPDDPRLDPARALGRDLFTRRMGQLNLSCAICHDANWGGKLAGATIPQGHPVGYPIYRLEWQSSGSLQRRLRACLTGIRAEPFAPDAPEYLALELYLMDRATGLAIETPAVRP